MRRHQTTGVLARDRFYEHLRLRNLAASSIAQRRYALGRLSRFMGPEVDLLTLTESDLDTWYTEYCGPLMPESRATELSHVRSFYRWCVAEGILDADPTRRLVRPRLSRRLPRPMSEEKLGVALEAADDRTRVIVMLAAFGGLRAIEIAQLRVEECHLDDEPPYMRLRGKGGKERIVPLLSRLVEELRNYIGRRSRGWVFSRLDGKPGMVPPHRISQVTNAFLHDNGIPETVHQLRHRFGTKMYAACKDLRLVQETMGHANPATTALYAAFTPSAAKAAIDRIDIEPEADDDEDEGA